MLAHEDETQRLRDLHDEYAWKVNAAVAEGREDLVRELADEYLNVAMRAMTDVHGTGCKRLACPDCARPRPVRSGSSARRGWFHRFLFGAG